MMTSESNCHRETNCIAFTGSTDVGIEIGRDAVRDMKRTVLELGGKSPSIICDDADIEQAVNGMVWGYCFGQGQVCCGSTRIILHNNIYDKFMKKFIALSKSIRIGNGLDENTQMGPLVSHSHRDLVIDL